MNLSEINEQFAKVKSNLDELRKKNFENNNAENRDLEHADYHLRCAAGWFRAYKKEQSEEPTNSESLNKGEEK